VICLALESDVICRDSLTCSFEYRNACCEYPDSCFGIGACEGPGFCCATGACESSDSCFEICACESLGFYCATDACEIPDFCCVNDVYEGPGFCSATCCAVCADDSDSCFSKSAYANLDFYSASY